MDNALQKELKKYIREVKKLLICDSKTKKKFIKDFSESLYDYADSKDETDIHIIRKHFGNPEEIAKSFLSEMDIKTVKKRMALKSVILTALIIIISVISVTAIEICIDSHTSAHGTGIETLYDNNGNKLSENYYEYY